jgi:hypothetical protein
MATLSLALLGILFATAPAAAQSLADTDDVLDGTRYLVRADDLVVADPYPVSSSKTQVEYFALDTEDMVITTADTVAATKVDEPTCTAESVVNTPFPQQTQTMRMFNLPNDVIVTVAPTAGTASGAGCSSSSGNNMSFYVTDPLGGTKHTTGFRFTTGWLHTVVADFDTDGYDDLFILSDTDAFVATAADTDSLSSGVAVAPGVATSSSRTAMADPTVGDFNADGNLDVAWMGTTFTSGSTPVVHFATVCAGPVDGTICAGASPFHIVLSSATISPSAPSGSLVTVGGKCTENENNQSGNELRSPAMAVAAGQFDTSVGNELLVASLYEDSNKECKIVAESYSFTQFSGSGSTGEQIVPRQEDVLDNLGPHGDIGLPSVVLAAAGRLDWSASKDNVAVAISSAQNHNVLVISLDDNLMMTSTHHSFSSSNNKSFAGLAIGRFSSAPAADASKSCSDDSQCTDTCKSSVCEISGADCTSDGDCAGTCTSDGICSYIKPNNYDLQIAAFLMAHNSSSNSLVYVYTADPAAAFTPKQVQEFDLKNFVQPSMNRGVRAGLLRAGDLQGRSQRLGAPTVVRIQDTYQPDLILAAPPSHADWLPFGALDDSAEFCDPDPEDCPTYFSSSNLCNCNLNDTPLISNSTCADGTELRCLVNFSALSGTFTSQYTFTETSSKQSSSTDTTSWSLGLSTDLKEKTKTLTPAGLEVTQEVSFATDNTYNHSVSTTNSSYKSETFNGATSTGFWDHVWYTSRDYNVYFYPVIGQSICVNSCQNGSCSISGGACEDDSDCSNDSTDPTNCSASSMQQLYVQYSGASTVSTDDYGADSLEWYQPVHEPGQIFSYPSSCSDLASRYGVNICNENDADYTLLSDTPSFLTDSSTQSYSLNWSVGEGSSRTASKGGQWSQSLSETVTVGTPSFNSSPEGLKLSESASINASESYSTANTNSTSLGSSTGISVAQPGTFLTPAKFAYTVGGYIFGQAPTKGTLQDPTPTTAEVQTNGVIRSTFTANPRASGSGSWWESGPYNQFIDVALNRPRHLVPQPGKGASDPSVTQCLPVSLNVAATEDCLSFDPADPTPTGLWSSLFYHLRGFFITPSDATGQGPQLQQANEGDVLALQTRIYNYSLQDMDVGEIAVDFYAQEWDATCNTPAGYYNHDQNCTESGGGVVPCENSCSPCCIANEPVDSIFIGQDRLDPLAAFDSLNNAGQQNWTLATTTFDTGDSSVCGSSGCGDKFYVFWVVVWPEVDDNNGNPALRGELPDHSLTKIPPKLTSIADLCPQDNSCVNGTCRATQGACVADTDCPGATDNTCGASGTCAVSGTTCTSDSDCGDCLCEVCIDEFSNNVGFFHQAFFVEPAATEASLQSTSASQVGSGSGILKGDIAIDRVSVSPSVVQLGEKTVVRAGLRAVGGKIDGQLVRFHAVPPDKSDLTAEEVFDQITAFDAEILSRIGADRVHEAQAPFFPQELGRYEILVSAIVDGEPILLGSTDLEVVENPPPTPTATVPAMTPTIVVPGDNDDGCAISTTSNPPSSGTLVLLLFPILFILLRSRHGRGERPKVGSHPAGCRRR